MCVCSCSLHSSVCGQHKQEPDEIPSPEWLGDRVTARFNELDSDGNGLISRVELAESLAYDMNALKQVDMATPLAKLASTTPQQLHLSLSSDPSRFVIAWAQSTTSPAQVKYGNVTGVYTYAAEANSTTYSVANGLYTSIPLFTANMTQLQPGTRYYYVVGNDASGWSSEYSFVTAPFSSNHTAKWAVYGDMGTVIPMGSTVTKWLLAEHAASPFNLALHVGDIAYAGVNSWGEWEPTWDTYMQQISPFAAQLPYMTTVGNHEHYFDYISYLTRFHMPGAETGGNGNLWFSFDYGNVHVTAFSSEHNYTVGSEQYNWMVQDLAAASQRSDIYWIFLACHRPLYSAASDEWDQHRPGSPLMETIEPLAVQYGVHLVLTGHEHQYERSFPVINGTVVNNTNSNSPCAQSAAATHSDYDSNRALQQYDDVAAPTYIVQGTSGAFVLPQWESPVPVWSNIRLGGYGYGTMQFSTFSGSNGAQCTSLLYQFKTENMQVLDQFILTKQISG